MPKESFNSNPPPSETGDSDSDDSGYKLFLLFEICSGFYDVIVFGDFSDTRPLTRKNSSVFA